MEPRNPPPRNGRYARLETWSLSIVSAAGLLYIIWVFVTKLT